MSAFAIGLCLLDNVVTSDDSEALMDAAIPGLDFSEDTSGGIVIEVSPTLSDTKTIVTRRKPIYTKPVPRAFERAWAEGRETTVTSSTQSTHPPRPHENSIGLLGESPRKQYSIVFLCIVHSLFTVHSVIDSKRGFV